jgi:hypothetical protein
MNPLRICEPSRVRVIKPEAGEIIETQLGTIVMHGCESLGMRPLNEYEEKLFEKYKDWPWLRFERYICYKRDRLGVDELDREQAKTLK